MHQCITQAAVVGSMLSGLAFWPTTAVAEHKCDNPRTMIDQRACAKAAEGAYALRSFVARTQTIWGLYYWDYARRDEPDTLASPALKPAPPADRASKTATATIDAQ
jgi:hypothetical protein